MKIYETLKQRSKEWFEARQGVSTGTETKKLFGQKKTLENHAYEIVAQRYLSPVDEEYQGESAATRGTRLEQGALELFEKETGLKTTEVGFLKKGSYGCSPDAMIQDDNGEYTGAVEIKCLSGGKHLKFLLDGEIPMDSNNSKSYYYQALNYFYVNDKLKTLHFVLFNPEFKDKPLIVEEFTRKYFQKDLDAMEDKTNQFDALVESVEQQLLAKLK